MKFSALAVPSLSVEDRVLPGDLEAGDVIELADGGGHLLVQRVLLGQGGFVLTVSPADGDGSEGHRQITLTAATPLRKRGRVPPRDF
jgi:hypothetical protein